MSGPLLLLNPSQTSKDQDLKGWRTVQIFPLRAPGSPHSDPHEQGENCTDTRSYQLSPSTAISLPASSIPKSGAQLLFSKADTKYRGGTVFPSYLI